MAAGRRTERRRVLVIVQNLPVPLDRRVWLECQALVAAGYQVSVICPKGPGDPAYQELDGVVIHKYRPAPPTTGMLSFAWEFLYCWLATAWLSLKVARRTGIDVIQACNPPDTYWALALLYRPFGVRFVYDQHDLNPELFLSRFGPPRGLLARLQYAVVCWLEGRTYRWADHVIATNDSYRDVALTRGRRTAASVTVVRSGPDTRRMRPVAPPERLAGDRHLLVYLGIMGPQDCVDVVVRALAVLVHRWGRTDVHAALLGFGDSLEELHRLTRDLDVTEHVTFTGRADRRMIAEYLSAAHIGLTPDRKTPLNDVSTMNKTLEYMAYALPVVAFDLTETRRSAGDAAVYVPSGGEEDVTAYAEAIARLLDDPDRRAAMGQEGRRRVSATFDWAGQARRYVEVFDGLTGRIPAPRRPVEEGWPEVDRRRASMAELLDEWGHHVVDLRDPTRLERFVVTRRADRAVRPRR